MVESQRIVVIDDVASARRVVSKMLEKIGLRDIVEVSASEKAISIIREHPTSLIISDCNMPGVGGFELVRQIRGDSELAHIPFIIMTSATDNETVAAAYAAGVSDFLLKPFSSETFRSKVLPLLTTETP